MSTPNNKAQVEKAFAKLLKTLGVRLKGEFAKTPARAAELWVTHLLRGEQADPREALGKGQKSNARAPIWVHDMGVHLVCPHHLTVAFGNAHVAYIPNGRIVGFGALSRLLDACTARFVLQEEAAQNVANTLVEVLGAKAALCSIDALHPCHNVLHGRSHKARATTLGLAGDDKAAQSLARALGNAASQQR